MFGYIDMHALDVGELPLAHGTALQHFEPLPAFQPVTQGARTHVRVLAGQILKVLLERFDAFDPEPDMVGAEALRIAVQVVVQLPTA